MFASKIFKVEAHRVAPDTVEWIAAWCGGTKHREAVPEADGWTLDAPVVKLPSDVIAGWGTWVVLTPAGFIACSDDAFHTMFEKLPTETGWD